MSLSKFHSIFPCFPCPQATPSPSPFPSEKATLVSSHKADNSDNSDKSALIAQDILTTLLTTHKSGAALRMHLDATIGTTTWTSTLAKYLLEKLTQVLRDGHAHFGPALRNAYDKATRVALSVEGFVVEHPVFCTVVALGVMAVLTPWVLGALGFVEVGIEQGVLTSWCVLFLRLDANDRFREFRSVVDVDVWGVGAEGVVVFFFSEVGDGRVEVGRLEKGGMVGGGVIEWGRYCA